MAALMVRPLKLIFATWLGHSGKIMRPTLPIEGPSIRLAAITEAAAGEPYLSWLGDPEVTRYLEVRFIRYDEQKLAAYIRAENERPDAVIFGIFDRLTDQLIGTLRLAGIQLRHRHCDIALMIGDRSQWGLGRACEAIRLGCNHAFDDLGLHKVMAGCYSNNLRSLATFLKAGFVEEGRSREERLSDGIWVDRIMLGRINPAETTKSLKQGILR